MHSKSFWLNWNGRRCRSEKQRKENKLNKLYSWLHPDSQSATWVMSVMESGGWICRVLRELLIAVWVEGAWGGVGWGGGGSQCCQGDSWWPPAEPCGLITRPRKCMQQTILNQHSLLQGQCTTELERGHNASAARRHKHFRQRENYISRGARGAVRLSSSLRSWLMVMAHKLPCLRNILQP